MKQIPSHLLKRVDSLLDSGDLIEHPSCFEAEGYSFYFVFGHVDIVKFFSEAQDSGIIESFSEIWPEVYNCELPHCNKTYIKLGQGGSVYKFCKANDPCSIAVTAIYCLKEHALEIEHD